MQPNQPPRERTSAAPSAPILLTLEVAPDRLAIFFQLLQGGFVVEAQTGCSVDDFLTNQLGIEADYVKTRIQTVFLNGKPVDDTATATVSADATLTLSAAMPGLAGAVLRKGGVLASMRHSISHVCSPSSGPAPCASVKLKLFNLIAKELGPSFLQQGIRVRGEDLTDLFSRQGDGFWQGVHSISLDAAPVDGVVLKKADWSGKGVLLVVKVS